MIHTYDKSLEFQLANFCLCSRAKNVWSSTGFEVPWPCQVLLAWESWQLNRQLVENWCLEVSQHCIHRCPSTVSRLCWDSLTSFLHLFGIVVFGIKLQNGSQVSPFWCPQVSIRMGRIYNQQNSDILNHKFVQHLVILVFVYIHQSRIFKISHIFQLFCPLQNCFHQGTVSICLSTPSQLIFPPPEVKSTPGWSQSLAGSWSRRRPADGPKRCGATWQRDARPWNRSLGPDELEKNEQKQRWCSTNLTLLDFAWL